MNQRKAVHDLEASLANIGASIELFNGGNPHTYRIVATELRKLLCDGKDSLLPRLFKVQLHPLHGMTKAEMSALGLEGLVQMPGRMDFDGSGGCILELFDMRAPTLELDDWLQQPLFSAQISLRDLIRSVADKEGAHSDKDYNDTLHFARSVNIVDVQLHLKYIIAIGEYILQAFAHNLVEIKALQKS